LPLHFATRSAAQIAAARPVSAMARAARRVLLLVVAAVALLPRAGGQPGDWLDGELEGHLLYAPDDGLGPAAGGLASPPPPGLHLPALANGYLGTQVGSDSFYINGVYNGRADAGDAPAHRARVPSPVAVTHVAPTLHTALDLAQAVYRRRSYVLPSPERGAGARSACLASANEAPENVVASCTDRTDRVWVEQRLYAHRVLRHLLVHEVEVLGSDGEAVNTGRPMDEHKPGEVHAHDHSHGHYNGPSQRQHVDVDVPLAGAGFYHAEAGGADGVAGGARRGRTTAASASASSANRATIRIRPVYPYASAPEVATAGMQDRAASALRPRGEPIAILKLALRPGATAPSSDIDFRDVTDATCALSKALDASAETKAALRGCGSEWTLSAGYVKEAEAPDLDHTAVVLLTTRLPAYGLLPVYRTGLTYAFLTVAVTSLDFPAGTPLTALAVAAARQYELAAAVAGTGSLFALHATAWRDGLWRKGIDVEGKEEVARVTRSSLYSLLSLVRADWPFGISPGGLSSPCYNGHGFWDGESFDWPSLNLLHPTLASALLLYRYHRLPGARAKARSYRPRYAGTMFPWESAGMGVESTPGWAAMGRGEIHITGDVAVAVWQHFQATGDVAWLRDIGYPVLEGSADFWLSRALADTPGAVVEGRDGREYFGGPPPRGADMGSTKARTGPTTWPLHIRGVIAATEFYHNVTDNALTNAVAKLSLLYAARAARLLGYGEARWWRWEDAAGRLVFPVDGAENRHRYFEGYEWGKPVQLLDVPLLHTVLGLDLPRDVAIANTKYYLGVFEGGAAFAYAVNAIAAADAGLLATAHSSFAKAHANFVHGPFKVWTEYAGGTGCPNFVTGAGGFLDALLFGYAGARLHDSGLQLEPLLPDGSTRVRIRSLSLRGHRFTVEYDSTLVTVTALRRVEAWDEWRASEPALLRAAHALAREHQAATAAHRWFWWVEDRTSRLFDSEEEDSPGWEAGHAFDPADPDATVAGMLKARPWLDTAAHLTQTAPAPGTRLVVVDARGRQTPLAPGQSASFGTTQKLLVTVERVGGGAGAGAGAGK
jgi:hypothetical protein